MQGHRSCAKDDRLGDAGVVAARAGHREIARGAETHECVALAYRWSADVRRERVEIEACSCAG